MAPFPVLSVEIGREARQLDLLAVEEPLEINVNGRTVAITMRTPGHDSELAAGFLFSEAILTGPDQIQKIEGGKVELAGELDLSGAERHSYMTSSCGVCGKASIEALQQNCDRIPSGGLSVSSDVLRRLPLRLRESQPVFEHTGGLHAAGLFTSDGQLCSLREDVGRHNALDKLIGAELLGHRLPLRDRILVLSGRISFELVQKAAMAGVPIVAAVGAPSSLAVQTALRLGITLAGFVRGERFNLYSSPERVVR